MTTRAYHGFPEMTYTAWNNGFGSWTGDKWHPGLTSVRALATGNFDLRTHCRVTRVTDAEGRAGRGVRRRAGAAAGAAGQNRDPCGLHLRERAVALPFRRRPAPGRARQYDESAREALHEQDVSHVDGNFPDVVFNRHTGPRRRRWCWTIFLTRRSIAGRTGFWEDPPWARRTSSCRSRSAARRCRRTSPVGGRRTRTTFASGSTGASCACNRRRSPTRTISSTSIPGTGTAAVSGCRSCASRTICTPTRSGKRILRGRARRSCGRWAPPRPGAGRVSPAPEAPRCGRLPHG